MGTKIAAVAYLLWGIIHVAGGALMFTASLSGPQEFVQVQTGDSELTFTGPEEARSRTTAEGVFAFHSFNIIWIGVLCSIIAVRMNWKGSGFWLNVALVGCTDLGLILFIVGRGILPLSSAWPGPLLFVVALLCSAIGARRTV